MAIPAQKTLRGLISRLNRQDARSALHAALLIAALGLAFYTGFIPRLDHAYPMHVDEWVHYDYTKYALEADALRAGSNHEDGFYIFSAFLTNATGLTELQIFRWLPSFIFSITALMVYLLGRRFGCGLESAFLVSLVPTTIRFLGPAFMVPIAMAMSVLPILLYLGFTENYNWKHALLTGIGIFFVTFTHPTSSILFSSVLSIIAIFTLFYRDPSDRLPRKNRFILMASSVAAPAFITLALQWSEVITVLGYLFEPSTPGPLEPVRDAIAKFGSVPALIALLGLLVLLLRGGWRAYAIGFSALFLVVVITVHYRTYIGYQSMADRSWLHLLLLMSFLAAYGIASVRHHIQALNLNGSLNSAKLAAAPLFAAVLVGYLAIGGLDRHKDEQYYTLMDDTTAADFDWIKLNLNPGHRTAIAKTDIAFTYPALTGGHIYAREAFPFVNEAGREAIWYLYSQDGPPAGIDWIDARGISLVYAPHWTNGGDYLDQPRQGIFIRSSLKN